MKFRLHWEALRESYWFVPALLAAVSIGGAMLTLAIDAASAAPAAERSRFPYAGGAEGARALLSTVAGSMITVAGVTFSITMVALTLTSSQFGPRLLSNFMRDRGNQVVLGTFIATFLYCLLVLRTVRGPGEDVFVPQLSVTVALLLALASIGVLIYFIHHVAVGIRAEKLIADVGDELDAAIELFAPARHGSPSPARGDEATREQIERHGVAVRASRSGYVQAVDERALLRIGSERDLAIVLRRRPGHFVCEGDELARLAPSGPVDDPCAEAVADCLHLGPSRTLDQDLEFAVEQLVEIALRALSPGINDPFTAIACIDRLSASLTRLVRREVRPPVRCDETGRPRVFVCPLSLRGVLDAAFDPLRQTARENVAVTIRLLEALERIVSATGDEGAREALLRHAAMIESAAGDTADEELDRRAIVSRCAAVRDAASPGARPA